jgi:hypothetical protein
MAMPKGQSGNPAGKPRGIKNRKTLISEAILAKVIKDKATPLEFLLATYQNKRVPFSFRIDAAKASAPYLHKKMPTDIGISGELGHNVKGGVMIVPAVEGMGDWATRSAIAQAALKEEVKK